MLEKAFGDLCTNLEALRTALRAVQVAASSDEALTGELRDLVEALDGVLGAAQKGRSAARLPADVDGVRRALPRCQRQFSLLKERFCAGMSAPATIEEHQTAGRVELAWYIGRCSPPLFAVEWAVGACWSRLAEYAALNPGGVMPGFVPPHP